MPRKNLVPLAGKPLIQYTIEAARSAPCLDRIIVSTDDEEIAITARALGSEVPFLRPVRLAADETPIIDVLKHFVDWLAESGTLPDLLVLLQPTSPLRGARHIEEAVDLFRTRQAGTVVSILEVPHQFSPASVLKNEDGKLRPFLSSQPLITRRQDKPRVYARNGPAILVAHCESIREGLLYADPVFGYMMDRRSSVDIDSLDDFRYAEILLQSNLWMREER